MCLTDGEKINNVSDVGHVDARRFLCFDVEDQVTSPGLSNHLVNADLAI